MRSAWILGLLATAATAVAEAPSAPAGDSDDLYKAGQQLFNEYAPPEVKEEFTFPSREDWDQFAARLQKALDSNSLEDLAAYEPEARSALAALRSIPGYESYADWLQEKIEEIDVARQAVALRSAPAKRGGPRPYPAIPYYDLWLRRERERPVPARAAELLPILREAFRAERVPPELAWIAEAESSLNPGASSPAGARGLFQLMPATAKSLGLSTFLPDERSEPGPSARACAGYLRSLYGKFGSWPLALAAYNAGEGRLRRALSSGNAPDFAGVAPLLPSETQMYVPKVCALVEARTGVSPGEIPPPGA